MVWIFDANAHPAVNGDWIGENGSGRAKVEEYWRAARDADVRAACAVGLPGVGAYEHAAFAAMARREQVMTPVAAWGGELDAGHFQKLAGMGFVAVKAHPRLLDKPLTPDALGALLMAASAARLPVFLCTYQFARCDHGHSVDLLPIISAGLARAPAAKLVLMHGGGVEVLRYAEFTRANPACLLDLSFTLCKYRNSSIDLDLRYLFESFDQRICIGSDFPEYSPMDMRERFEALTAGLPEEKKTGPAWHNLAAFLGVETELAAAAAAG